MNNKNTLLFPGGDEDLSSHHSKDIITSDEPPWKIMVIDDDQDVHHLTKMVLENFIFENRAVEFISGYSGADARRLIQEHRDTAIVLLDVVMETDKEGLKVVQFIRDELKNPFVRIILRTGQPGHAPESKVISEYDINDYVDKVNLTDQRLETSITTSLRAFNLLRTVENTRTGLRKIIEATSQLYEPKSLGQLATGILTQLAALISHDEDGNDANAAECFAVTEKRGVLNIYAAFGVYESNIGQPVFEVISPDVIEILKNSIQKKISVFTDNCFLGYFQTKNGMENLIYLKTNRNYSAFSVCMNSGHSPLNSKSSASDAETPCFRQVEM